MAKKKTILEQMRENPRNDWTIADVGKVVRDAGLELRPPSGGSHYVVVGEMLRDVLTIPHKRPIKALYIKNLVSYVEAHERAKNDG